MGELLSGKGACAAPEIRFLISERRKRHSKTSARPMRSRAPREALPTTGPQCGPDRRRKGAHLAYYLVAREGGRGGSGSHPFPRGKLSFSAGRAPPGDAVPRAAAAPPGRARPGASRQRREVGKLCANLRAHDISVI